MQKSLRSIAVVALLSLSSSMYGARMGTDPRPQASTNPIVVALTTAAYLLGL